MDTLHSVYVDLHIHIGRTEAGQAVKISAANNLTFYNIAHEASERKGIEVIGIIDCHSPGVQREIRQYVKSGEMRELQGGGIRYHQTTVLLGCELEVRDPGMGPVHLLVYLPDLSSMESFTSWLRLHMKNVELSSQRLYVPAKVLQSEVEARGGILVPAHIFTPHKSIYGSGSTRMEHLLELNLISAVELGLSADSTMAGLISELDPFTFLTNSDAHSLPKIGREYNRMALANPTYEEVVKALHREEGRHVEANYGLNPRLGKYHRTYCLNCSSLLDKEQIAASRCLYCGSSKMLRGVMDRIQSIADRELPVLPDYRPPYHYQIPLEFIPGLGKRKMAALLNHFGTEMNILHEAREQDLVHVAGQDIAHMIHLAREGRLELQTGGGGQYGKVKKGQIV
ncbi:endonuclease Q family protein [Paenibacillus larvae]|uniref:Endonuclease Q family protein n=1 Tax=Paenibacillus larvae TaxID=1464 RepID=A0AAP5N1J4_9BACL|nr:endonuclease Q family protein [Paenibacillus larvae]AQR79360.1 hypothetical protein BXP28_21215 [Paenibacillus larvae subsp. larvae]AVF23467.1 hypothetical protein ERICI_03724 [Paenibacillus larvae subsp. larvae]ETK25848.1 hypothetical protein ERIC1_2c00360 [Paenibacillus larvae subsp. larvae DSM 25719]MCY7476275.1 endonuclease Q family protein [Paenibacillus larvae]MCY7489118.1 endonuclease Q family protein [Paenibacillus larvae]